MISYALRVIYILFLILFFATPILAITDPLAVPNNKLGLHVLFTTELQKTSEIVNGKDGQWGYVVIPIQATDRNRPKWQKFLDDCKEKKLIPIIRIATVPESSNWAEPNNLDLIDFANFLNDLHWPTQNHYVIIFNEVNRGDEFNGKANPEKYADILINASNIFKSLNEDFFILPAGLDNATPTNKQNLNHRIFIERMYLHQPKVFDAIDGWTSHAYPNPDFSTRPDRSGKDKIDSYRSDIRLIRQFTTKKFPVFITEAGWSTKNLSDHQVALYYDYALKKVWIDSNIVTIAPFLLDAQDGPFKVFSFLNESGQPKEFAEVFSKFATKGEPVLTEKPENKINKATPSTTSSSPANNNQESSNSLSNLLSSLNSLLSLIRNLLNWK